MSDISIGTALGAGFELITKKPLTVLAWGLVRIGFVGALFGLYIPVLLSIMPAMMDAARSGSESGISGMTSQMGALNAVGYLVQFGSLLVSSVLICAVTRSQVHPERSAFAYMRVGAAEFFVAVFYFIVGIAVAFAIIIGLIPFAILVAIFAVAKEWAVMAVVIVIGVVVLIVTLVYVGLRFCFVAPMMVEDGEFHIFESWTLTRGRVGSLFGIGISMVGIAILGELLIGVVFAGLVFAGLGVSAGGMNNLEGFFHLPPAIILARLAPWLVVSLLLAIPIEGAAMAIFIAPWARAYREIKPDVANVFAGGPTYGAGR